MKKFCRSSGIGIPPSFSNRRWKPIVQWPAPDQGGPPFATCEPPGSRQRL